MYSIISLYLGLFFLLSSIVVLKIQNKLFKQVVVVITVKIIILTILYLLFFSNVAKLKKDNKTIENKIIYNEHRR